VNTIRCLQLNIAAAALIGLATTESFGQLVNGKFEQPNVASSQFISGGFTGWTVIGPPITLVDENNGSILGAAFDGEQYVDLTGIPGVPGPKTLSQVFPTVPGAAYAVSFAYSNDYGATGLGNVRVFIGDTNLLGPESLTHTTAAPCDLDWTVFSGAFTATGSTATIAFTANNVGSIIGGVLLDGVSVHLLSNPPSPCPADIAPAGGNGQVNIDDLLAVINAWGSCPGPCPQSCDADIVPKTGDGQVNIDDLLKVINEWGSCH
jgi:hypothetical protein